MAVAKVPSEASLLDRVVVRLIEPQGREEFDRRLKEHNYLHQPSVADHTLRYIALIDDRPVAILLFSSAALHIKARDKWIGWSPRQRVRRVHRGVNNARFLVESFVDESRFRGTCYKACGFEPVGASAGFYLEHGEPKRLFLRQIQRRGRELLRQARLTHPNGTDLTVRLEGRNVGVSDGVISAEDIAKGWPHTQVWLPAGEVYVVPGADSAEGKIVIDRVPFENGEFVGVTLTVKGGKRVAHTGKPSASYDRWRALYTEASAKKNDFALLDIGINPNVTVPAGSKLSSWVPAGTVSVGFDGNIWTGCTNDGSWDFSASLNGCTLRIDDKLIVDAGVLKVQ